MATLWRTSRTYVNGESVNPVNFVILNQRHVPLLLESEDTVEVSSENYN